jgi:uncharacterized surface protein with fasciclin (FAS1) repeats
VSWKFIFLLHLIYIINENLIILNILFKGGVTFGGANVVIPDIKNVQGVIHIIDAVILPDTEYPADKKYSY